MSNKINFNAINEFLESCGPETKIYVGCDSRVYHNGNKEPMISYTTAVVVHINGKHGGKLFYENSNEKAKNLDKKKPNLRLMTEVYKVSQLYLDLIENVDNCLDKSIEIHLDINPDKEHKSSAIITEALGYIRGVCQVDAKVKPEAWAASTVADAF